MQSGPHAGQGGRTGPCGRRIAAKDSSGDLEGEREMRGRDAGGRTGLATCRDVASGQQLGFSLTQSPHL